MWLNWRTPLQEFEYENQIVEIVERERGPESSESRLVFSSQSSQMCCATTGNTRK